ncbi:hypothetical protein Ahia01_000188700, partial [Argonauta hians]
KLDLMDLCKEYKVRVNISDKITVCGRDLHVKEAKSSIKELLLKFKVDDIKKSLPKVPSTWSPMKKDELLKIVEVTSGKEYDDIVKIFSQSLPSYRVIRIERIQNITLYRGYQALKEKFNLENSSISNEVKNLWHGTADYAVHGINNNGFNRSYCGKNAVAYGQGVYFAKDIRYSAQDTYSTPDSSGIKRIYKCCVLVGQTIRGNPNLKVLPKPYNSAVNDTNDPSIFVTFHDSQVYPQYSISFRQ